MDLDNIPIDILGEIILYLEWNDKFQLIGFSTTIRNNKNLPEIFPYRVLATIKQDSRIKKILTIWFRFKTITLNSMDAYIKIV